MENRLDRGDYIELHILGAIVLDFFVYKYLFKYIPSLTYRQSFWAFLLIQIAVMGIGIFITLENERNFKNMLGNFILSWGVFVCIAYRDFYSRRINVVLSCFVVYTLIVTVYMVFMHRKLVRELNEFEWPLVPGWVVDEWRKNLTIASLLLIVSFGGNRVFHGTIMNASAKAVSTYTDADGLNANINAISNMEPVKWQKLDIRERLNVCQKLANCEGRYLGVGHELNIGVADLNQKTVTSYTEGNYQIIIDVDYLSAPDGYRVLKGILHACYHAYQIEQIKVYQKLDKTSKDLLLFYDIGVYEEELGKYKDGDEFTGDKSTQIERDAEEYAQKNLEIYFREIRDYLNMDGNAV